MTSNIILRIIAGKAPASVHMRGRGYSRALRHTVCWCLSVHGRAHVSSVNRQRGAASGDRSFRNWRPFWTLVSFSHQECQSCTGARPVRREAGNRRNPRERRHPRSAKSVRRKLGKARERPSKSAKSDTRKGRSPQGTKPARCKGTRKAKHARGQVREERHRKGRSP